MMNFVLYFVLTLSVLCCSKATLNENCTYFSVYNGISLVNCTSENKCLPSFLIAGTQKSGTTALAAHLSNYPRISLASRKEVHYFDKTIAYNKGVGEYLKAFHSWNSADASLPPLYGEATPFYIASRVACKRIARVVPDVKMIVLLRDPVKRAYSEYQMKKRRVEQQSEFFAVITHHEQQLLQCMRNHSNNMTMVQLCVPEELGMHPRWIKLRVAVTKLLEKSDVTHSHWTSVIDSCFPDTVNTHRHTSNLKLSSRAIECRCIPRPDQWSRRFSRSSTTTAVHRLNPTLTDGSTGYKHIRNKSFQQVVSSVVRGDFHQFSSMCCDAEHVVNFNRTVLSFPSLVSDVTETADTRHFDFRACWKHSPEGFEELPSLKSAFWTEIEAFQVCGGEALRVVEETHRDPERARALSDEDFASHLRALNVVIDRCLTVRSGISTQYFYRSLYVAQLTHCFQSLPANQFLILPSERLRRHPNATLDQVLSHIGLHKTHSNIDANIRSNGEISLDAWGSVDTSQEGIASAVSRYFPVFEKTTGWRLESGYEAIPNDLHRYLEDFFRPYNTMLFRLINQPSLYLEW